jgi:hypothetical protein
VFCKGKKRINKILKNMNTSIVLESFLKTKFRGIDETIDKDTLNLLKQITTLSNQIISNENEEQRDVTLKLKSDDSVSGNSFKIRNLLECETKDIYKFWATGALSLMETDNFKLCLAVVLLGIEFYSMSELELDKQDAEVLYAMYMTRNESQQMIFSPEDVCTAHAKYFEDNAISLRRISNSLECLTAIAVIKRLNDNHFTFLETIKLKR